MRTADRPRLRRVAVQNPRSGSLRRGPALSQPRLSLPRRPVVLWLWDDASEPPGSRSVSVRDAEGILGIRAAREALEIDRDRRRGPWSESHCSDLDHDPQGAQAEALAAGPRSSGEVVRQAIADGRSDLAVAVAIPLLARVVDRERPAREGRVSPLIEALNARPIAGSAFACGRGHRQARPPEAGSRVREPGRPGPRPVRGVPVDAPGRWSSTATPSAANSGRRLPPRASAMTPDRLGPAPRVHRWRPSRPTSS